MDKSDKKLDDEKKSVLIIGNTHGLQISVCAIRATLMLPVLFVFPTLRY
jgi:hypothetical protein